MALKFLGGARLRGGATWKRPTGILAPDGDALAPASLPIKPFTPSGADAASYAITASDATAKVVSGAAPAAYAITAVDATSTVIPGTVSIVSAADPASYTLTAASATGRLSSISAATAYSLTAFAGSDLSGSTASSTSLALSATSATAALTSIAGPSALNVTAFDAVGEAFTPVIVTSDADPFVFTLTLSDARIRMEFDMILPQELSPEQITAIAAEVVAQLAAATIPVNVAQINGVAMAGAGVTGNPWRPQ